MKSGKDGNMPQDVEDAWDTALQGRNRLTKCYQTYKKLMMPYALLVLGKKAWEPEKGGPFEKQR